MIKNKEELCKYATLRNKQRNQNPKRAFLGKVPFDPK